MGQANAWAQRNERPPDVSRDRGYVQWDAAMLSRRRLLGLFGAAAVQLAVVALPGASGASSTKAGAGGPALPPGWFDDAEVALSWTIGGPHGHFPTGTVGGQPLEIVLAPSQTAQGLKVYTVTGHYGSDQMRCVLDFGPDGDSFRATGFFGTSPISIDCAPEPPGTTKWPVTGVLGGEPLKLELNSAGKGSVLTASVGDASIEVGLTDVHVGPDAGEDAGSKGRGTFTLVGSFHAPGLSRSGEVKLVYVLQGYGSDTRPPLVTLTGRMTGPSTALIAGLAFLYASELQD